jgi:hypothetical protein
MSYAADPAKRAAILAAERRRLDWLEANPAIPVMEWGSEKLYAATPDEVTATAALAEQEPEELAAGFRVIVRFGAGVSYVAYAAAEQAAKAVAA